VALLLPFSNPDFYPISDAIERGFTAAKKIANDNADVKIYASQANAESALKRYQQALAEGSKYIVGPLTPSETNAIGNITNQATTLMLNKTKYKNSQQYSYGLFAADEIQQIIKISKNLGMQKVTVISSNTDFNHLITQNFIEKWQTTGGLTKVISTNDDAKTLRIKCMRTMTI